ncbi:MAG: TIGR02147 family protein [Oligoflexia bacterium]|nr:TIGR02147 family protein [Oligoflexia bacterium]
MKKADSLEIQANILTKAMERVQRKNPSFSLRSAAKKLEISPSFLSRLMKGKTKIPLDRIDDFSKLLKLDKISENLLLEIHLDKKASSLASANLSSKSNTMRKYEELPETHLDLLEKWYYIAILDLSGCESFKLTPKHISNKIGITELEAKGAIDFLTNKKYLKKEANGSHTKAMPHFRFPTKESLSYIRNYHKQMLRKAFEELDRVEQKDFEKRLIAGVSIACNPQKIAEAQTMLNEAMYRIAEFLNDGEKKELYHLMVSLWPISK